MKIELRCHIGTLSRTGHFFFFFSIVFFQHFLYFRPILTILGSFYSQHHCNYEKKSSHIDSMCQKITKMLRKWLILFLILKIQFFSQVLENSCLFLLTNNNLIKNNNIRFFLLLNKNYWIMSRTGRVTYGTFFFHILFTKIWLTITKIFYNNNYPYVLLN